MVKSAIITSREKQLKIKKIDKKGEKMGEITKVKRCAECGFMVLCIAGRLGDSEKEDHDGPEHKIRIIYKRKDFEDIDNCPHCDTPFEGED